MVLSHLDIKSLTRALRVSKYWHETILGAIELRQNLFLAPKDDAEEFLRWKPVGLENVPFVVRNPTPDSRPIIKTHPVLAPDPRARTCLDMYQGHRSLKTVSPSTLLTQPPVTEVKLEQELLTGRPGHALRAVVKREQGVTFGDAVEEIEALRARGKAGESVAAADGFGGFLFVLRSDIEDVPGLEEDRDDNFLGAPNQAGYTAQQDWHYTRIEASGLVAEASQWVLAARERLEEEFQGSESSSSDVEESD